MDTFNAILPLLVLGGIGLLIYFAWLGRQVVVSDDGKASLKLSSGQWRKYPSLDDLKMNVDAILGR